MRIHLDPGKKQTIAFSMPASCMAFWDAKMNWIVERGQVEIAVGASSEDIRLADSFCILDTRVIEGKERAFYAEVQNGIRK